MSGKPLFPSWKPKAKLEQDAEKAKTHNKTNNEIYDVKWRKLRAMFLTDEQNQICGRCGEALSEMVDHVLPVCYAPEKRLDWDNLMGMCFRCHHLKTLEDYAKYPDLYINVKNYNKS